MIRILLATPPETEKLEIYKVLGVKAPPLGLAWIGAVLEEHGYKVKILDSTTLGLNVKDFMNEVKTWHPDIIGISAITPTVNKAYEAVRYLKEYDKNIPVVMGGPHVTFMCVEALNRNVDIVVRGEGEYTMLELVQTLEKYGFDFNKLKRVKGIAFKYSDKVIITRDREVIKNLDELPYPARHLLPMDKYTFLHKPIKIIHVMASRGCPYGCTFCSSSYFWGRYVRFRSPKNVIDEIEECVSKYRTNIVVFTDDELTLNRKFIENFIKELRERKLDIQYTCGARVDHVDAELLKKIYDSGCISLYFGVESGSQETLNRIGKRISLDQVKKVFSWIKKLKKEAVATFMLGFPWETLQDMKLTIKFAVKLNPTFAQFTIVTPYPGTPLFKQASKEGLIEDWNWDNWTTLKPVMRGYFFNRLQVKRMLTLAYLKFYGRASFIFRELIKGRIPFIITFIKNSVLPWLERKLFMKDKL